VQLDFVQPMRFDLKYQAAPPADGAEGAAGTDERPVMVHRAVLGSVERMMAILTEHYAGKWPFFLSPRQAMVVPVSKEFEGYANSVQQQLHQAGYFVDVELSRRTLNKMVREAQLAQYNYILVVGAAEKEGGSANVRTRDNQVHGTKLVADIIAEFGELLANHTLDVNIDLAGGAAAKK